jgi:hypothetical protein
VSSIVTSGYHRTAIELAKRQNLSAYMGGAVLKYRFRGGSISVNTVQHKFAFPMKAQDKPYDVFGINGNYWSNYSIDYSYTFQNLHSYGEYAVDRGGNGALLQGFLVSVDKKLDFAIVYRNISKKYQSITGSSFTENSTPSNERGLYAGIVVKPAIGWVLNLYGDFFDSPWLRFRTDAPARGRGYLLQLIHTPNKKVELYTRFSNEQKYNNVSKSVLSLPEIKYMTKKEFRVQFSTQFTKELMFRSRVGLSWYGEVSKQFPKKGFLGFTDLVWKPLKGIISGSARLQYYDVDDYDTRIYAYENGPLYDMSIPAFDGTGWRYYLNARLKPKMGNPKLPSVTIWLRYGSVVRTDGVPFGSGLDKIDRSSKSDIKLQILIGK